MSARIVTTMQKQGRPVVRLESLYGSDGNAYAILGACLRAMVATGYTDRQKQAFASHAMRGDYAGVLTALLQCFAVEPRIEREARKLIVSSGKSGPRAASPRETIGRS